MCTMFPLATGFVTLLEKQIKLVGLAWADCLFAFASVPGILNTILKLFRIVSILVITSVSLN